nr:MAG TPA: hypothetical protein [Caudoviricetes sp.]
MAVGGGCVVSLFVFLFSLSSSLLLVFGVVRAQPCEHARYPRTPLCFLLLCSLLFAPRLSSRPAFPFVGMAVCDSPCVGVPSWHDCDG